MTLSKKFIVLIAVSLEIAAFIFVLLAAAPLQSSDDLSDDTSSTLSIPDPSRLKMVSFSPIVIGNEIRAVIVYDDPATRRPIDYVAMYDGAGDLLGLKWFDRFGIERMAIDRGLINNADHPAGVFVAFLRGDSL